MGFDPRVLVAEQPDANLIAATDHRIYWSACRTLPPAGGDHAGAWEVSLLSATKTGADVRVEETDRSIEHLVGRGPYAVAQLGDRILQFNESGERTVLVEGLRDGRTQALAANQEFVFWLQPGDGEFVLFRVPRRAGSSAERVLGGVVVSRRCEGLAASSERIFWRGHKVIESSRLDGSERRTVASLQVGDDCALVLDGPFLYFGHEGGISRVRSEGGQPEPVVSTAERRMALALDEQFLYWMPRSAGYLADPGPDAANRGGILRRVPKSGGQAEVLDFGPHPFGGLVVEPSRIYWTVNGSGWAERATLSVFAPEQLAGREWIAGSVRCLDTNDPASALPREV